MAKSTEDDVTKVAIVPVPAPTPEEIEADRKEVEKNKVEVEPELPPEPIRHHSNAPQPLQDANWLKGPKPRSGDPYAFQREIAKESDGAKEIEAGDKANKAKAKKTEAK